MPARQSNVELEILSSVAAASPGTTSEPRTSSSPKSPNAMIAKYRIPATRAPRWGVERFGPRTGDGGSFECRTLRVLTAEEFGDKRNQR